MQERSVFHEFVFSMLMSFTMAYAMEFYNNVIMLGGNFGYDLFWTVLKEAWWITLIVYVVQTYWGAPLARKIAFSVVDPQKDRPYVISIAMTACMVWVMCPTMSLVACLIFKQPWDNFLPVYLKTVGTNFPMALLWQLFFAGPLVKKIDRLLFKN